MKWISNKALYAEHRSTRQMYYAWHSARRYAKRFGKGIARQLKAERVHLDRQRRDAGERGIFFYVVSSTWTSKAGSHKRKFNREWIRVEAESKERQIKNDQIKAAEREQIRTEVYGEILSKVCQQ